MDPKMLDLRKRTKAFAHDCVKIASTLPNTDFGRHLKDQLSRSATSVAVNYRATSLAQSKAAFIAKLSIVVEEADESHFWLEFIKDENLNSSPQLIILEKEASELTAIFIKSRITASNNNKD
jgi:four helix bundle protein